MSDSRSLLLLTHSANRQEHRAHRDLPCLACLLGVCCPRVDCPHCPIPAALARPHASTIEEGLSRTREGKSSRALESKGLPILTKQFWVTLINVFSGRAHVQHRWINLLNTAPAHFWPHPSRFCPTVLKTTLRFSYVSSLTIEAGGRHALLSQLCSP